MEASAATPGRGARPATSVPVPPRLLRVLSDEALVAHVRRGEDAAFEAIFDRHHRRILSFCRHMLGRPEEAEDAVQQTFLSAYDALRADDREIRLRPWLYAIARNASLTLLRARREAAALDEELHGPSTEGLAEEVQRRDDLRALVGDLGELPTDQRAALVLAELGDLSHPEIAGVLGCEERKVKALVFQARERLLAARQARDADCAEMRETLATATGGVLRRGPVRRHLKVCPSCATYAQEVKRQRAAIACVLPVVPSLALKQASLPSAALGSGGAAAAAAAGGAGSAAGAGSAGGAGATAALGVAGTKAAAVVAAGIVATGSGVAAVRVADHGVSPPVAPAHAAARHPEAPPRARGAGRTVAPARRHPAATAPARSTASPRAHGRSPAEAAGRDRHHGAAATARGRHGTPPGHTASPADAAPGRARRFSSSAGGSATPAGGRGRGARPSHPSHPATTRAVPARPAPSASRPAPARPLTTRTPAVRHVSAAAPRWVAHGARPLHAPAAPAILHGRAAR